MPSSSFVLRARWVIPMASPPIEGGVVAIRSGRIVGVGHDVRDFGADDLPTNRVYDLGDVALLPGFVNAHTHLEFSNLTAPLGKPGMSICDWIPLVVAERRRAGRNAEAAVRAGIAESARCGVTAIGEIAQPPWSPAAIESLPLAVNVYLELIGLAPERVDELGAVAREHIGRAASSGAARWRPGVSPHAPYSVHRTVVQQLADFPLAMHVAESPEELELLASATGPMRQMLTRFGAWREGAFGGLRPADFLRAMIDVNHESGGENFPPALVVHGNYLNPEDFDVLAAARRPICAVYCPRTHAFFEYAPYPLAELTRRGIAVAIGTDSRASNPDLSVLAELRFIAERHAWLNAEDILRMGTIAGATALDRLDECGSLEAGKSADLAAVAVDAGSELTPYEQVLHGRGNVVATIAAGKVVYDPHGLIPDERLG